MTENIPPKYLSKFAMSHNAIICFGFILTFGMGSFLPDGDDSEGNFKDENWRIIFLLPAPIGLICSLLVIFVFKYEPINYCIMMGYDE